MFQQDVQQVLAHADTASTASAEQGREINFPEQEEVEKKDEKQPLLFSRFIAVLNLKHPGKTVTPRWSV